MNSTIEPRLGRRCRLRCSIKRSGTEILLTPLTPDFWRGPTDNDFRNYMPDWAAVWEQAGRNRTLDSFAVNTDMPCCAKVTAQYSFESDAGDKLTTWVVTYEVTADGRINVDNEFTREESGNKTDDRGDDSWGKRTLQQCSLSESAYRYGFTLIPYANRKGGLDVYVQR